MIKVEDLAFAYKDSLIFDGLSFTSNASLVALQGASGSGKTTLLKLLSGFLIPSRGSIKSSKDYILILQEDALLPWKSGIDNLALSPTFSKTNVSDQTLIKLMSAFTHKLAMNMSFGQRRFIELMRALGSKSDILYLDEPLNFLDKERRDRIIDEIVKQSESRTIVASTHYIDDFGGADIERWILDGDPPHKTIDRGG